MNIVLLAGEASGDLLGAHLLSALQARLPDARFYGIGGPRMLALGFESLYPQERLAVRGYVEVLGRLPELLRLRRALRRRFLAEPPDLFVGIDAPDFNLALETALKAAGTPVAHYVGPSVWAWRAERIHALRRAADHVLLLFPFEPAIYERAGIPATYVGHPLALTPPPDRAQTRAALDLPPDAPVIALLPGSRQSELQQHAALFVAAAQRLLRADPRRVFLVPLVDAATRAQFERALAHAGLPGVEVPGVVVSGVEAHAARPLSSEKPGAGKLGAGESGTEKPGAQKARADKSASIPAFRLLDGGAARALAAADGALIASGTATLEAALCGCPMVITYRMPRLSHWYMGRQQLQPWVGLPNILAGRFLVPELLQDAATPEGLAAALEDLLTDPARLAAVHAEFDRQRAALRRDSGRLAADALIRLLESRHADLAAAGLRLR